MWRSKKFIIGAVLAGILLVGSLGGIALAQTENGDDSQPETLLERVTEILVDEGVNINSEQLKGAFVQAQDEMREEALDNYLNKLVDEGRITEEQADQYKEWLRSRPDMTQYRQQLKDWQQARPGIPPELDEWREARPDVSFGFGFRDHSGFRGIGGLRGLGGPCFSAE